LRSRISAHLDKFERKYNIDLSRFSREDLKLYFEKQENLQATELTAIEGIHYSRGKLMEKSPVFNKEKLIDWLVI
jgi:hypothetical protein